MTPGLTYRVDKVKESEAEDIERDLNTNPESGTGFRATWLRFRKHKLAVFSLVLLAILAFMAIFAPVLAPYNPNAVFPAERLSGPSATHIFGQDQLGRDVFSRILYGARVSLSVGFIAGGISLVIGVILGALAGFYGGWVDNLIMRSAEIMVTIPQFLLVIAVVAVLGPDTRKLMVVIGLTSWNGYARQVRAKVMQIKRLDYVEAAQAIGCDDRRLLVHHIIPNAMVPIIVMASLNVANVILLESSLTFLGFGAQPPQSTWGSILYDGRSHLQRAPHICGWPGFMIMITVLAFNLLGDG
ncbi:MAG: ABC transporter permease, partial [Symbiobacteriaceae bacterium]|nr:ABC transporter permease [Symbiobacteriaceae bacterium]